MKVTQAKLDEMREKAMTYIEIIDNEEPTDDGMSTPHRPYMNATNPLTVLGLIEDVEAQKKALESLPTIRPSHAEYERLRASIDALLKEPE